MPKPMPTSRMLTPNDVVLTIFVNVASTGFLELGCAALSVKMSNCVVLAFLTRITSKMRHQVRQHIGRDRPLSHSHLPCFLTLSAQQRSCLSSLFLYLLISLSSFPVALSWTGESWQFGDWQCRCHATFGSGSGPGSG